MVEEGARLAQIWKRTLIRRVNASRIPFEGGKHFGERLPWLQACMIDCQTIYKEAAKYASREAV